MGITPDSIPQLKQAAAWNGHAAPLAVLLTTTDYLIGGSRDGVLYRWPRHEGSSTPQTLSHIPAPIHDVIMHQGVVIAAYDDGYVRVWQESTLKAEWQLHTAPARALLAAGDTLYSAGEDGTLQALNLEGEVKWSHEVAAGGLTSLAKHPDFIVAGGQAGTLHLFDADSGEPLGGYVAHDGPTVSVTTHPLHNWLLTAGSGTIRDWSWDGTDLHDGAVEIHLPRLRAARYTSDGALIVALSAAHEQHLTAWHAENGDLAGIIAPRADAFAITEEAIYRADPHAVERLTPDPTHVTEAAALQELRAPLIAKNAWRLRPLATLIGHRGAVNVAAASPDGAYFASASVDRTIRLWDAATGENVTTLTGHRAEVRDIAFSPDGTLLASASGDFGQRTDDSIRTWIIETGEPAEHLEVSPGHRLNAVCYTPQGDALLAGGMQGWIEKWPMPEGERSRFGQHTASINAMHISGERLVTGSGSPYTGQEQLDSAVRVFDLASGTLTHTLHGHTHPVTDVATHPNDTVVISVDTVGNMLIWDSDDERAFGYQEGVTAVALSSDGSLLAVAYRKPELRVLKMLEGRVVLQVDAGEARIRRIRFSPDGNLLLTAHEDGMVQVWGVTD